MDSGARATADSEVTLKSLVSKGVVADVLDAFARGKGRGAPEVDRALRDFLQFAIHKRFADVGGARTPERIPKAKLSGPFFRTEVEHGARGAELLCVLWARASRPLQEAAATLLRERGLRVFDLGRGHLHPVAWKRAELEALAAELVGRVDGARLDQAALMLYLLADSADARCGLHAKGDAPLVAVEEAAAVAEPSAAPPPSPDEAPAEGLQSARLRGWVSELAALEAGAAEWAELDAFVSECQRLASARRAQAAAVEAQVPVREALARLASAGVQAGLEAVPHLKRCAAWEASLFAAAEAETVARSVTRLADVLEEVARVMSSPPRTVQESLTWTSRIQALQQEAEALADAVEGLLAVPPQPPRGGDTPVSEGAGAAPVAASAQVPSVQYEARPTGATPQASEGDADYLTAPLAPASVVMMPRETATETPAEETSQAPATTPAPPVRVAEPTASVHVAEAPQSSTGIASAADAGKALGASESQPVDALPPLELLTRRESAEAVLASRVGAQPAFLLSLVAEGDYAAGYWLARALESTGADAPLPSWLLEAVAGSVHLAADTSVLGAGLLQTGATHEVPEGSTAAHLLALAVALRTGLGAPHVGLTDWLEGTLPHGLGPVSEVVNAVRDFAHAGVALPDDVRSVLESRAERTERIAAASQEARRWLERAPLRSTPYHAATLVWAELARGKVAELLDVVVRDSRGDAERLVPLLQQWTSRSFVEREVQSLHERRNGPKARALVGAALKKLFVLVEEACAHALRWHELVTLEQKLRGGGDWLTRQVVEVRARVERALPASREALLAWREDAPASEQAAASALLRSLGWLGARLGCQVSQDALPADVARHQALVDAGRSLRSVLAQRLVTLPALQLPGEGEAWDGALTDVGLLLAREVLDARGVRGVVEGWLERGDFRFLLELCESAPEAEREELLARVDAALAQRRAELRTRLAAVRAEVERAHVEGSVGDERAELLSRLEPLNPDETLAFAPALAVLDEVARALAASRAQRLEVHRRRWAQLQARLPAVLTDEEQRTGVVRRVEEVLQAADTRSADELLTHLFDVVEENASFNAPLFEAPAVDAALEGFVTALAAYEAAFGRVRGREVPRKAQEVQPDAPASARRELATAHGAWLLLTQARTSRQRLPEHLDVVLRYLGFLTDGGARQAFSATNPDGTAFRVAMSAGGASPVPQFGSRAEGRYRVVCVWEREGVNTLDPALAQLPQCAEPTVVVYLGRLSASQRRSARAQARRSHLDAVVLDEWLLLYLELFEASHRLGAFFRCALPWAPVNPYVQRAGTVPPEMFFGRSDMARVLAALDGPSIVYGGRQLGKSALLEHVQRSFHAPAERRFAVRLDIKTVGDPGANKPPVEVWARLRDALKAARFLSVQVTTEAPERLRERILEQLGGQEKRQLLILLDEADNFLDADARHAFEQVQGLRDLMNESGGRCKVVFAGLHNVQRFQAIGNQPLAHFGLARRVGPLDPREAVRLITEPLAALGFRFDESDRNAAILHILSYTNYHPGLIQLFCRNLVQLLQARAEAGSAPYLVREEDVRAVYRQKELRELIRDCFVWTIALDPRYEATVLALVAEQLEEGGDYARAFSAGAVLELALYWWRAGFASVQSDRMRGLLDEMVGLGVLVTNSRNEYRLRSPNVVRLLGTRDDITNRLLELGRLPAPPEFDADHHHALLPDGKLRFSPLTFAQERQLLEQRAGVTLLFGSAATHVGDVRDALLQLAQRGEGKKALTAFVEAPATLNNPSEWVQWLKEAAARHRDAQRLFVLHGLTEAAARRGELVDAADAFCAESTRTKGPAVRVVLTLEAAAGWAWLSGALPQHPEREAIPWLALKRWTPQGVRRLLDMADMAWGDEALLERVCQRTTGGWHALLHALAQDYPRQEARRAADTFEGRVGRGGPAAAALWKALGLEALPLAAPVLSVLASDGELVQGLGDVVELLPPALASQAQDVAVAVECLARYGCVEVAGGRPVLAPLVAAALP